MKTETLLLGGAAALGALFLFGKKKKGNGNGNGGKEGEGASEGPQRTAPTMTPVGFCVSGSLTAAETRRVAENVDVAMLELAQFPGDFSGLDDARDRAFRVARRALVMSCPNARRPSTQGEAERLEKSQPKGWGVVYNLALNRAFNLITEQG